MSRVVGKPCVEIAVIRDYSGIAKKHELFGHCKKTQDRILRFSFHVSPGHARIIRITSMYDFCCDTKAGCAKRSTTNVSGALAQFERYRWSSEDFLLFSTICERKNTQPMRRVSPLKQARRLVKENSGSSNTFQSDRWGKIGNRYFFTTQCPGDEWRGARRLRDENSKTTIASADRSRVTRVVDHFFAPNSLFHWRNGLLMFVLKCVFYRIDEIQM